MTDVGRRRILARPHSVIDLTLVNSIHAARTETEMGHQVLIMPARNLGTNDIEEARRQALARLPIGRMGTVTDIAKGIVFLASDDAGFMTGAGLVVDGRITGQ
jgi:3(or 17)beta-hydroxysteroid dehydrogenase